MNNLLVQTDQGLQKKTGPARGGEKLNPAHTRQLMALINDAPFFRMFAMKMIEIKGAYSLVEMDASSQLHNPFGTIHGGVYTALVDTAAYWSVYAEMDESAGFITLDVNTTLLGPFRTGKLIVEGKRIKIGRSICLGEAAVYDESGKLLAHGNSKMAVVQNMHTINIAVRSMGYPPLPPKFL